MTEPILVTGATGTTGSRLVQRLTAAGHPVRAASRKPSAAKEIRFDWGDPGTHLAAVAGVRRMYLVAPVGQADPLPQVEAFLATALAAGLRRVVLLSSSAVPEGAPVLGELHALVRRECPEWTVLRPSWFMQNFLGDHPLAVALRETGELVTATGNGRVGFVDAGDIAAVAERALLADTPLNEELVITGPAALSYADAAAILTALGVPARHRPVSVTELTQRHIAAGYPPDFAALLAGLDEGIRQGAEDRVTDTVLRLTGRPPCSLRAALLGAMAGPMPTIG
ncbi:NAD(P)H-binding protein [Crossiella sp. SN42]|uniref:NAD(P)H-binding protein n=1 Tax=Crossiella sp. SN42 TaxID=2944808 RepID=UPI00207CD658|nr:NAD(P)H-binding protein [Crossiella sp. SN42]MCO1580044.1 NAD(P)H-binding protein [Crossiella sp. SN42]